MPTTASEFDSGPFPPRRKLKYRLISERHAICKLPADAPIPAWALLPSPVCSITRSRDELSIVCLEENIPAAQDTLPTADPIVPLLSTGWICLKLEGPFPFTETGILASFLDPLSANGIPIFAVSTFDTDYVLIAEQSWGIASEALRTAGHEVVAG
jgi:uncharacterized protein